MLSFLMNQYITLNTFILPQSIYPRLPSLNKLFIFTLIKFLWFNRTLWQRIKLRIIFLRMHLSLDIILKLSLLNTLLPVESILFCIFLHLFIFSLKPPLNLLSLIRPLLIIILILPQPIIQYLRSPLSRLLLQFLKRSKSTISHLHKTLIYFLFILLKQ